MPIKPTYAPLRTPLFVKTRGGGLAMAPEWQRYFSRVVDPYFELLINLDQGDTGEAYAQQSQVGNALKQLDELRQYMESLPGPKDWLGVIKKKQMSATAYFLSGF